MRNKILALGAAWTVALLSSPATLADGSRDTINIVGSSTVYPFSSVVAERFGKGGKYKTPKVESTGTGGGVKLFCSGVGVEHPDIANASRRMKKSEYDNCQKYGVKDIVEVKIGYDGIVLAQTKGAKPLELTRKEIYLALAKRVPDPSCSDCDNLVTNPYKNWNEINPALPNTKIEVLGPPPTSGTRDAFAELAMEGGCQSFSFIKSWKEKDEPEYKKICQTVRDDGAYIEAGENDNLIVQKLGANKSALGIFGYSFLDQNPDKVQAAIVDGVEANMENIASNKYPISRPLFFYVKKGHIGLIPGIEEFIAEFTSNKAIGSEGYLVEKGLIPMPADELKDVRDETKKLTNFSM